MDRTNQLALAGMSVVAVSYGLARYGFGLFVPVFSESFGISTQEIGVISSAGYSAHLVAMILTSVLVNRIGPKIPVVTGALCAGMGMLLISAAQGVETLIPGVILASASPGFCFTPFSDSVAMLVDRQRRSRVLSIVSTGTTFGLVVVGPVALLANAGGSSDDQSWRYAWVAFAVVALLVAIWNATLLPAEPYRDHVSEGIDPNESRYGAGRVGFGWFLCRASAPLFGQAFLFGLVAAFYYTYAVDLVQRGELGDAWGPILWSLVGLAGVTGLAGGDAVCRFGLRRCLTVCLALLAASIGLLTLGGGSSVIVASAALMFGASYMPVSAFLVIWSAHVFHQRPSVGLGVVFLWLAAGSVLGPTVLGAVAGAFDLRTAFWCAAVITALTPVMLPRTDIHSATPETAHVAGTPQGKH